MLTPKQRRKLLVADRTHAGWVCAVIEHMLAADPTMTLAEVDAALRDAAAHSYLIAGPGETFHVITGMPAWHQALAEVGLSPQENRAALLTI